MSNARKLQTEIDRVMKKVDEGVEIFDETWEKVYSAEQQNQKEKYEEGLKKEIKKLQRLRDQIKTWIGSSDVKDKEPLLEARRLIETKMEQFKICEKETKTKTYSKEGLAREEKLDPAEEAKLNTTNWLGEYIEKLQGMVEDKDFEIEKLSSGKGKKTNKNQIEELNDHIANHKYHISKLEGIIRLVNNDRLEVDPVNQVREDLDYYLESYDDDDYMQAYDEEFFYEALGLDELDVVNVDRVTQAQTTTKKEKDDTISTSSRGSKDKKTTKKSSISSVIPVNIGRARVSSKGEKKEETTPSKPSKGVSIPAAQTNGTRTPPAAAAPVTHSNGASMAAILKRESEQQEKERQQKARDAARAAQAEQLRQQRLQDQQRQQEALRQQEQEALKRKEQEALRQQQESASQQTPSLATPTPSVTDLSVQSSVPSSVQPPKSSSVDGVASSLGGLTLGTEGRGDAFLASTMIASQTGPSNGVADSIPSGLLHLSESFGTAPGDGSNERNRQYIPHNPYPAASSYPTTPSPLFENPVVFEKLGTDCLFFIFYYAQGTYQQYLAARELKKQSWRFHKKYMTWFQRHEEPKITTDEYEQGTYVYFDYETGWCTRIKTDFRFEYSYLEDSLQ